MARTVTLTKVHIITMLIDVGQKSVEIKFDLQDAEGNPWKRMSAVFWATMPPQVVIYNDLGEAVGLEPYPDNWFKLPATRVTQVASLVQDAMTALTGKFIDQAV